MKNKNLLILVSAIFTFSNLTLAASKLEITPSTYDFGWSPDNAKITAEFVLKNTGSDMIPLTAVQPACGCTATQFSPESLGSSEETKVQLTFNTRGYAGTKFSKTAKVKTDSIENEYTVTLKGSVTDSTALISPVGDGIASFDAGTKEKKKSIEIQNKSADVVALEIIQNPASWAKISLRQTLIEAGKTTSIDIQIDGTTEENRDTSVTIAAKKDGSEVGRFTVAIRSGTPPAAYKRYVPPTPTPVKTNSPDNSKKK
jgi:acylphosphatase